VESTNFDTTGTPTEGTLCRWAKTQPGPGVWHALGQGMTMILAGAGAGGVATLLLTRFLASLNATDAAAFGEATWS